MFFLSWWVRFAAGVFDTRGVLRLLFFGRGLVHAQTP